MLDVLQRSYNKFSNRIFGSIRKILYFQNLLRQAYIILASGYSVENYNQRFETKIVERFSGETLRNAKNYQ